MDEKEKLMAAFAQVGIEGLDPEEGIGRFAGQAKLYVKIIKTFVDNMGAHLDTLAGLTQEELEAYGVQVHGVKGSCYGISANREGDMAKELEMAAKAGDYEKVLAGNAPFIATMNELIRQLSAVLVVLEGGGDSGQKKAEPDKAVLAVMLQACRDFDVEMMQESLKNLEQFEYESGGDLVVWLGEQVTAFGYDKIEERLASIL